jgi:hypothetical protein
MNKKGFRLIRIWVNKNDVSIEFQGYKGRMHFSLNSGSDLYEFLQNINFDYVELYHHKVLKAEADFTSVEEKQQDFYNKLCGYFNL